MSLEQAIRDQWSLNEALTACVPLERLFTGQARGEVRLPLVLLERPGDERTERTSNGRLAAIEFVFVVWASSLDQAKSVAAKIDACFERRAFAWSNGQVLDCRLRRQAETPADDGAWRVAMTFTLQVREEI